MYWSTGLLICWSTSLLVCWSASLLVYLWYWSIFGQSTLKHSEIIPSIRAKVNPHICRAGMGGPVLAGLGVRVEEGQVYSQLLELAREGQIALSPSATPSS